MAQYVWKQGGFRIKAQVAGDHLEELQQQHGGRLTPRIILDAARPVDALLHPCFEWDDTRAAELYREDQARNVVRSIRVVQPTASGESRIVRAFVNIVEQVGNDIQHAYVPVAIVMADEAMRTQLIARAKRDLLAFKDRYTELTELVNVIDGALEIADSLQSSTAA